MFDRSGQQIVIVTTIWWWQIYEETGSDKKNNAYISYEEVQSQEIKRCRG
jgi:hypothetical protein